MKYKVGDRVIVRSDLIKDKLYGWYSITSEMYKLRGKTVTIKKVREGYFPNYSIEECNYPYWTNEMFVDKNEHKYLNL